MGTVSLGKGLSIHRPKRAYVSAREFIKIVSTSNQNIKTTRYYPSKLGSRGLGKFYIEFK